MKTATEVVFETSYLYVMHILNTVHRPFYNVKLQPAVSLLTLQKNVTFIIKTTGSGQQDKTCENHITILFISNAP
jgi:hypothetical protein